MTLRSARFQVLHAFGVTALLVLGAVGTASGQAAPPAAEARFDPSDVYFQGYLESRAAEQLESAGDYIGAIQKLNRASQMFGTIQRFHPDWKAEMVAGRSGRTDEDIARVRPLAEEQHRKNRSAVAELEGGPRAGGEVIDPGRNVTPLTPGILEVDPLATRRLKEAEDEVERLRRQAASGDIARQNDFLRAKLRAAEANVESLRARLAAAPMEREMKSLSDRIQNLEQEREAMAMALGRSRDAHTEALSRIEILEVDLKIMRQKQADLNRDLQTERKIANSVVAGQRRQLTELEKKLEQKDTELSQAHERIAGLVQELQESRDAFAQMRDERDGLLRERDQMAALLKLNEASRIQDLIEQNMSLAKRLREADERVDRLNRDSNADKDALNTAKRDLAVAKAMINGFRQERIEQEKRIGELKRRLESEDRALAAGRVAADPLEIEELREIIRRQLRVQERRRQARDLLVEAARELGKQDEGLAKAIELFDAQELELSPEEMKLVAGREVDGEFVSPFARDRATVGAATADLNRSISSFERAAEKAFVSGRYLATREIFETILDQNPGHTPSLCRVGVVHLRLDEPERAADSFRRATELDSNNPYAFRMLGYALMKSSDLPAAEQSVRRAVDLAPGDAIGQTLLATLLYRLGRVSEAESHFKAAIAADPMPSEPYYNLSLIVSRDGRLDEAREYYEQALERGALPDPKLEELLAQR